MKKCDKGKVIYRWWWHEGGNVFPPISEMNIESRTRLEYFLGNCDSWENDTMFPKWKHEGPATYEEPCSPALFGLE